MSEPAIRLRRDLEWVPYEMWVPGHTTVVHGLIRSTRRLGDRGVGATLVCAHHHPGMDELVAYTAWNEGAVHALVDGSRLLPVLLVPVPVLDVANVTTALDRAVRDGVLDRMLD